MQSLRNAFLFLFALGMALPAFSQDGIPQADIRHVLTNSAALYVTPRGQKYFATNMENVLGSLGFDFRSGFFAPMKFQTDKPIELQTIAKSATPGDQKMVLELKKFLETWLIGFTLNSHRPKIEIGESGYVASFKKFSLVADQATLDKLGKDDGAVLVIELEIDKLNFGADSIQVEDLGNPQFGKVRIEGVKLNLTQDSSTLRIKVPVYINMTAAGILEFQTLSASSNFAKTKLSVDYAKMDPLQMKIFVKAANGQEFEVSNAALQPLVEAKLKEALPDFLPKVSSYLDTFVQKDLPTWMNQKAHEFMLGKLEQINFLEVPNAPAGTPPFVFGLRLERLRLFAKNLMIQFASFVEDPSNIHSKPLVADGATGVATVDMANAANFDMALVVNRSLVNRILQLSTDRGVFKQIDISSPGQKPKFLKIVGAPKVSALSNFSQLPPTAGNETFVKINARIESETEGTKQWLVLKSPYQISFDIIAKLRPSKDGKIEVVIWKIDENSMSDISPYLKIGFKDTVVRGVKEVLTDLNKTWEADRQKGSFLTLPSSLPLPPEIAGLKTAIYGMNMDSKGHLILYLTYGGSK